MAAGMGTRFGKMTELSPKGFIEYKGIPMVVRSIENILACGVEKIIIGTGYHKEYYEHLTEKYPQIQCVFSPKYAETNSMYTLWNCREAIDGDFLLLESDLIYEKKALEALIDHDSDSAMLITPITKFQDQYYVEMDENGYLTNCSTDEKEVSASGELVGIHKISKAFFEIMAKDYEAHLQDSLKTGYEFELLKVSRELKPLKVLKMEDLQWYEIDDERDLRYAEENVKI